MPVQIRVHRTQHKIIEGVELKHCTRCDSWKPFDSFYRDLSTWDQCGFTCKECILGHAHGVPVRIQDRTEEEWEELRRLLRVKTIEAQRESARQWYRQHPEAAREFAIGYRMEHPEVLRRASHKRRAALAMVAHEDYDDSEIYARDKGICQICGKAIEGAWDIDHFYPIGKGGPDIWDNVRIAHPRCNGEKRDHLPTHAEAQAWLAKIQSWSQPTAQIQIEA